MSLSAPKTEEIALGFAVAVIGAIFLWAGWDIPTGRTMVGPRSVPAIASGLIMFGGFAIALAPMIGRATGIGVGKPHKVLTIVLPAVALALAALWLWGAVGWTLATLIVAPIFFAIFGARGWRELVLFPLILVSILYLIFYQLLGLWHGTGWLIDRLGWS